MNKPELNEGEKTVIKLLNQVFELEKKAGKITEPNSLQRNINRIKEIFEQELAFYLDEDLPGYVIENPLGEPYNEKRTDCEASIAGEGTDNLFISEVIRPIIRYKHKGQSIIVQKAIVVAQSK